MVSSKQGIDVVVVVFIVARRFFFNEFLNRSGCLIRCIIGWWGLFGLIRHWLHVIICEEVIFASSANRSSPSSANKSSSLVGVGEFRFILNGT